MSLPREVIGGRTYLVTRRCTQRQFLMRPDPETNEAFIYCLAVAAERHHIQVLFTLAMSNHHHTGIHDPHGNYPAFLEYFHKLFAKCQNTLRSRWENFWASEQTSVVRLEGPNDVLDKLVYTLTNPVKDDLVERSLDWPGVSSFSAMMTSGIMSAKRPAHFFRDDGPMPKAATLPIYRPHGFDHLSPEQWGALLRSKIASVEADAAERRRTSRTKVLGVTKVLQQDWRDTPVTSEPRRTLRPRLAAKNQWRRVELILQNKAFVAAYAEVRRLFLDGWKHIIFPRGTYWLARFASAVSQDVPFEEPPLLAGA